MSPGDLTESTAEHQPIRGPRIKKGLVIVNTGDGKGKTTAALGVLFRAWGRGMRVRMFQFLKHSGSHYGEHRAARKLDIPIEAMGDGFTWRSKDIDVTSALAREQWARARSVLLSEDADVIILDEFTYCLHYGWVTLSEVLEVLSARDTMTHVVITGRHAPDGLIAFADLVTEMRVVKHPYREQGIKAQPGIEF